MIVWSALIIRILVVTTYVIDEDHLETLWKCCKRHHLYDGRQFLARKLRFQDFNLVCACSLHCERN